MSDEPARLQRAPHVLWRTTLDTVVLLPVTADRDEPFSLTATGAALWSLLAVPRSVDDVVEVLAESYGASPDVVAADLAPLLEQLLAAGAIESA